MKGFLCLLIVSLSCQSLLCEDVSLDAKYIKPRGSVFIQGDLPKRGISDDKIRSHTSSKVNVTRVTIEDVSGTTTPEPELPSEVETEAQEEPETKTQKKLQPHDEPTAGPKVEPVIQTDNTFLPCSFLPCPFNAKTDKNPKFKPITEKSSTPDPKITESIEEAAEEYRLSLEFYHSLSFQLLLISLFCLTMVLLLTAVLVAMYRTKNGYGLRKFRKLENRDCGLNKYNF